MAVMDDLTMEAGNVLSEAWKAHEKYGDFTSTHEAYGVLAEEVAELLESIRQNLVVPIAQEARQVSAVALRLAAICERCKAGEVEAFWERSGF